MLAPFFFSFVLIVTSIYFTCCKVGKQVRLKLKLYFDIFRLKRRNQMLLRLHHRLGLRSNLKKRSRRSIRLTKRLGMPLPMLLQLSRQNLPPPAQNLPPPAQNRIVKTSSRNPKKRLKWRKRKSRSSCLRRFLLLRRVKKRRRARVESR